tara:strand:- start:188 stop:523 length:336 start_codon:yes stop_codon:yes gene_type:complete
MRALIDDGLIEKASVLGQLFHEKLKEIRDKYSKNLKYIFGEGMVAALIFIDQDDQPLPNLCDKISELAFQRGLLVVHTGRESIKLAPPLSISEDALLEGLEVLDSAIGDSI